MATYNQLFLLALAHAFMIYFLEGTVDELSPTYLVLNVSGVGYQVHISIHTFEKLSSGQKTKILIHQIFKEDSQQLFGFMDAIERSLFQLLISVSGVGASTARLIQSHLKAEDLRTAIATGDVPRLKSVKGVGAKTAERIIVDLKDKVINLGTENLTLSTATVENKLAQDALTALEVLGYNRFQTQKVVDKIIKEEGDITLENIIKKALKNF